MNSCLPCLEPWLTAAVPRPAKQSFLVTSSVAAKALSFLAPSSSHPPTLGAQGQEEEPASSWPQPCGRAEGGRARSVPRTAWQLALGRVASCHGWCEVLVKHELLSDEFRPPRGLPEAEQILFLLSVSKASSTCKIFVGLRNRIHKV